MLSDSLVRLRTATLLRMAEEIARAKYDGHLTILRFTTHWKAAYGTPHLYSPAGSAAVANLTPHPSLKLALIHLLVREPNCWLKS